MTQSPEHAAPGAGARIRLALESQGFLLVPEALEPALVDVVRDELDRALDDETERHGAPALEEIGQLGYVADLLAMGPATRSLLDADVVHEAVTAAVGADARLSIAQGISLGPGQGRGQWPRRWHADLFEPRAAMPDGRFCFGVNCLMVLDDMTAENGATCVLPGSQAHVVPRSSDGSAFEPLAVPVAAPAGSLLLIDGGLWHAAGHNTTDRRRRVLKLLFVRGWIRPQLDYAALLAARPYDDLTPRATALLGAASLASPVAAA